MSFGFFWLAFTYVCGLKNIYLYIFATTEYFVQFSCPAYQKNPNLIWIMNFKRDSVKVTKTVLKNESNDGLVNLAYTSILYTSSYRSL